jgi:hypothetical protein
VGAFIRRVEIHQRFQSFYHPRLGCTNDVDARDTSRENVLRAFAGHDEL